MDKIYVVRQIYDLEYSKFFGRNTVPTGHAYAYMTSMQEAVKVIENNIGDVNENAYFKYAAIDTYRINDVNATGISRVLYKLNMETRIYEKMSNEEHVELLKGIGY